MKQNYCWWCESNLEEKPKDVCCSLEHLKFYISSLESIIRDFNEED